MLLQWDDMISACDYTGNDTGSTSHSIGVDMSYMCGSTADDLSIASNATGVYICCACGFISGDEALLLDTMPAI